MLVLASGIRRVYLLQKRQEAFPSAFTGAAAATTFLRACSSSEDRKAFKSSLDSSPMTCWRSSWSCLRSCWEAAEAPAPILDAVIEVLFARSPGRLYQNDLSQN